LSSLIISVNYIVIHKVAAFTSDWPLKRNSYRYALWAVLLPRDAMYNKLVRPRWPYDMRPSARAENYVT